MKERREEHTRDPFEQVVPNAVDTHVEILSASEPTAWVPLTRGSLSPSDAIAFRVIAERRYVVPTTRTVRGMLVPAGTYVERRLVSDRNEARRLATPHLSDLPMLSHIALSGDDASHYRPAGG